MRGSSTQIGERTLFSRNYSFLSLPRVQSAEGLEGEGQNPCGLGEGLAVHADGDASLCEEVLHPWADLEARRWGGQSSG